MTAVKAGMYRGALLALLGLSGAACEGKPASGDEAKPIADGEAAPAPAPDQPVPGEPAASAAAPGEAAPPASAEHFDAKAALDSAERALIELDALRSKPGAKPDPEQTRSWLPDEGLRSLYHFAKRVGVSLRSLERLFGVPVFASGPHGEHPTFAATSVGAYNPVFVRRLAETARALAGEPERVERTRPAFTRQLREQAEVYLLTHRTIRANPRWYEGFKRDYVAQLERPGYQAKAQYIDDVIEYIDAVEEYGLSPYEAETAVYFWVRRDLDGTEALWVEAIQALLTTYAVEARADFRHRIGG